MNACLSNRIFIICKRQVSLALSRRGWARGYEVMTMSQVELRKQAPDFELKDYKGEAVRLSDFAGRKAVLIVLNRGLS